MSAKTLIAEVQHLIENLDKNFTSLAEEFHTEKVDKKRKSCFFVVLQVLTDKRVLSRIFSYLSDTDLLKLRLVNQKWDEVVCSVLTSRNACEIVLEENKAQAKPSSFFHKNQNKDLSLQQLNDLLENICVNEFPCHRLRFTSGKLDDRDDLLRLFYLFGKKINKLVISPCCEISVSFFELILPLASNLQGLKIVSANFQGSSDSLQLPRYPVIFHELKTLHFSVGCVYSSSETKLILKHLLRAAVNLKELHGTWDEHLTIVSEENKIHLIKTCVLFPSKINISAIQQLANNKAALCKLTIRYPFNRRELNSTDWCTLASAINTIMKTSKLTLRYLNIIPLCTFPDVKIPALPNLRCLEIRDDSSRFYNESTHAIFPLVANFGRHFQNLQVVCLYLKGYSAEALKGYFPDDAYKECTNKSVSDEKMIIQVNNPFPTVTHLDINYLFTLDEFRVKALAFKFPNVKHVRLCCGSAKDLNSSLWYLPLSVESIELHNISVFKNNDFGTISSEISIHIDSFFTGIPEEMCKTLRLFPRAINDPELIQILRTKPSVSDMKSLKRLSLYFSKCFAPFMSRVSSDYGFRYVSDLRAYYSHDHCRSRCTDDPKECEKYWSEVGSLFEKNHQHSSVPFSSKLLDYQPFQPLCSTLKVPIID